MGRVMCLVIRSAINLPLMVTLNMALGTALALTLAINGTAAAAINRQEASFLTYTTITPASFGTRLVFVGEPGRAEGDIIARPPCYYIIAQSIRRRINTRPLGCYTVSLELSMG